MTCRSAWVYVDDVRICSIPVHDVEGMIKHLRSKGIVNIKVKPKN